MSILTSFWRGEYYNFCSESTESNSTSTSSTVVTTTDDESVYDVMLALLKDLLAAFTVTTYILMALYSCVYAYYRLTRPGMSAEIRMMFIRKHISYVTVYVIIWTINLASTYYNIYLTS